MLINQMETDTFPNRRLLLIAYSFPPVGGAGVQRPAKWTKYLPEYGWNVTVLTPENPSVPLRDDSLLAEIPPETRIIRAPTWEPDYRVKLQLGSDASSSAAPTLKSFLKRSAQTILQPDLQILWARNAILAATKELKRIPHDAILVTVPPYSAMSIGVALKRRFRLPLIFDFRDEWDLSNRYLENTPRNWWSHAVQNHLQRRWLKQVDAVIATTQASAQSYAQKLANVGNSAPACCIYNGFDPEDLTDGECPRMARDDIFRLVYTGTLWNLTDIEPLVTAIERLQQQRPDLLGRLELACVGRKTPEQKQILDRVQRTQCRTQFLDYCAHGEIGRLLHNADALCLLLSDVPGAERVVPAKLFEYLAAQKPILSIAPHGEATRIVRRFLPEGHFVPRDVKGIAEWLADRLSTPRRCVTEPERMQSLQEFSRRELTGRLAELLNSLTEQKPPVKTASNDGSLKGLEQMLVAESVCDA